MGVLVQGTKKTLTILQGRKIQKAKRTRRKRRRRAPRKGILPPSSESPLGSEAEDSLSLSVQSLSFTEEDDSAQIVISDTKKKKKKKPLVSFSIPGRHKSLIGRSYLRDQVTMSLELARQPCDLYELRMCRKLSRFCDYIVDIADSYRIPSTPGRKHIRNLLNTVLRLPIRQVLDHWSDPVPRYSPNLPIWLYRRIIKSLSKGNRFIEPTH